jgi:hypothetical protein
MLGQQFLDIAKKLVSMRTEAALRTAVGRGYYAAFNCAVQFLMDLGFPMSQSATDHAKMIINALERFSHEPLRAQLKNGIGEYHRKVGLHS